MLYGYVANFAFASLQHVGDAANKVNLCLPHVLSCTDFSYVLVAEDEDRVVIVFITKAS